MKVNSQMNNVPLTLEEEDALFWEEAVAKDDAVAETDAPLSSTFTRLCCPQPGAEGVCGHAGEIPSRTPYKRTLPIPLG